MDLRSLRSTWKQRRLDLAIHQIQNPASLDELIDGDPMQIQIRAERATMMGLGALSKAKSKTDWKGD